MALYIQLLTLTPEGRAEALQNSHNIMHARDAVRESGVQNLALYGVLGIYDYVNIVEATDNESIARFSLKLGVRAGVHIITLPAIPIGHMEPTAPQDSPQLETEVTLQPPGETSPA